MTYVVDDGIEALRARLAGFKGAARTATLLRLGQAHATRAWRAGPGLPAALPDVSAAIEAIDEAYGYLDPRDSLRGESAALLGLLLAQRHSLHDGPERDRTTAIHVLEEALTFPHLPPLQASAAGLMLGQLYLTRAARDMASVDNLMASMRGGQAPPAAQDVDRGIDRLRRAEANAGNNEAVAGPIRAMLTFAEALRTVIGGFGPVAGGFDLAHMMTAIAPLQRLQQQAMRGPAGGMPFGAAPNPFLFDGERLARLDPLDRPVAVVHGTDPSTEDPRPAPRPAAAAIDRAALRRRLTDILAGLTGAGDAVEAAATLLRRPDPEAWAEAIDDLVETATAIVHTTDAVDPGPGGIDQFVAAVALHARARLDPGWGDGEPVGDHVAGAEGLVTAAETLPPDHPAAVVVVSSIGAFLDDHHPLGGVLDRVADRLADRIEAVIATDTVAASDLGLLHGIRAVCRASSDLRAGRTYRLGPLARAVGDVPPDYPWRHRLRSAADLVWTVADAASPVPSPSTTDLAAALRAMDAAGIVFLRPVAGDNVGVVLVEAATARIRPFVVTPATAEAIVEPLLAGADAGPRRLLVVDDGHIGLASARTPTGRHATHDLVISYVASAAQAIDLARRRPAPVGERAVFLANPRGDRELDSVATLLLRRSFYPGSTGLGRTVEDAAGTGTPTELLTHLDASMLHLGCGIAVDANGEPALEMAGSARLDAATIAARSGDRAGGLVVLPPDGGSGRAGSTRLADALMSAGFAGVVDWLWPVAEPVATLMRFVLHAHLVDHGMSPADAVRAVHRWMLDPGREPPPYLPPDCRTALTDTDLTDPRLWAALALRGR